MAKHSILFCVSLVLFNLCIATEKRRIVVATHCDTLTGGPIALAQLAIALHRATFQLTEIEVFRISQRCIPYYVKNYKSMVDLPTLNWSLLKSGDAVIIPEVRHCLPNLRNRGVRQFVYMLAFRDQMWTRQRTGGCEFIAHTHWLAQYYKNQLEIPVIRPFMDLARHKFPLPQQVTQSGRKNLILVDNDNPVWVLPQMERLCTQNPLLECEVRFFHGIPFEQCAAVEKQAKVVIDWCLVGAERMPVQPLFPQTLFLFCILFSLCS